MGKTTKIEYVDSTINPVMGCRGCELWSPKNRPEDNHCYAEKMTNRYAGKNKGFPADFGTPEFFPGRIEQAIKWPDLTGTDRPDKPHLNGKPRIVFVNDMGDGFTENIDIMWPLPYIKAMEQSPHFYLWLTKRPRRMYEFFASWDMGYVPNNFMLGTTITSDANYSRLIDLIKIRNIDFDCKLWISFEPLLSDVPKSSYAIFSSFYDFVVVGAESGANARPMNPAWARLVKSISDKNGTPFFMKQMSNREPIPDDLNIRQFPEVKS